MAQICICTNDRRLQRMLSLLCAECGHTVGDTLPSLLITDEEIPTRFASLPLLRIGKDGLARPFSHEAFKARLDALLSLDGTPILTPTERRLYDALREASPAPLDRATLSMAAFGTEEDDGRLNLYIHYLRKKIEADGKKRIFACRGKGYFYDALHPCR